MEGSRMEFKEALYAPPYVNKVIGDMHLLVDAELPNWIATDARGARILSYVAEKRSFEEIVSEYAKVSNLDFIKAWLQCYNFIKDAFRAGFVSTTHFKRRAYPGRGKILKPEKLSELWLHVTNACNLSCRHCLVNAGPKAEEGISTKEWKEIVTEACKLGVERFYITGGEPFMQEDIFELLDYIKQCGSEAVILTNGTLLKGKILRKLAKIGNDKIKIQISLDGSIPKINDAIRGEGSFKLAVEGTKNALKAGFKPAISTTVMRCNAEDALNITKLAARLGANYHHLLFAHERGRATLSKDFSSPPALKLVQIMEKVLKASRDAGIKVDNFEFAKSNISGRRGIKRDLSNIAYDALCIYCDGHVYPSASLAGHQPLDMGVASQKLKKIWLESKIAKDIRSASVVNKEKCHKCYLRFVCGGGDLEHAYIHSTNGSDKGSFLAEDPLCKLNEHLITKAMYSLARERRAMSNSGFNSPVVYYAMGEGTLVNEKPSLDGHEVSTSCTNCVLFLDLDKSREIVRRFYAEAAKNPRAELCCATGYIKENTSHIPKEVLEVSYGCGSPVDWAKLREGEVVVDLGPGGGTDCFIAAKKVGKTGKVYGIDMTDEMLERANKSNIKVAKNLGYNVVEFRQGYLEDIPLPDNHVDVVVSNCVINLSPDKKKVFFEMFRILKNHGRAVISDTISDEKIPEHMKANPRLWGECISGALTEDEYLAYLERAGFHGLSISSKSFWKEVEGHKFYSAIIEGYKFEKKAGRYIGQKAIYKGPFKATMDEEGHLFPRNEPIEISTDTAAKLKKEPYSNYFEVVEPDEALKIYRCCGPGEECTPPSAQKWKKL